MVQSFPCLMMFAEGRENEGRRAVSECQRGGGLGYLPPLLLFIPRITSRQTKVWLGQPWWNWTAIYHRMPILFFDDPNPSHIWSWSSSRYVSITFRLISIAPTTTTIYPFSLTSDLVILHHQPLPSHYGSMVFPPFVIQSQQQMLTCLPCKYICRSIPQASTCFAIQCFPLLNQIATTGRLSSPTT